VEDNIGLGALVRLSLLLVVVQHGDPLIGTPTRRSDLPTTVGTSMATSEHPTERVSHIRLSDAGAPAGTTGRSGLTGSKR